MIKVIRWLDKTDTYTCKDGLVWKVETDGHCIHRISHQDFSEARVIFTAKKMKKKEIRYLHNFFEMEIDDLKDKKERGII